MPIYEYTCLKCSKDFELLVRSPGQKIACPECNSRRAERKLSLFGMKSSGTFSPSKGGSDCSSCSSSSCSSCSH